MRAFISHNRADKKIAREIALFLVAENVSVWFDDWEVAAGDSIVGKVEEALGQCTHFVFLWSENAAKSNWVRREMSAVVQRAIESGNPRVIPVRLDDTPLPALLADLRYIRYRGGLEEDRVELAMAVTGTGPSSSFIRAVVKKYHEVIKSPQSEDTFGLVACPHCGSKRLEPWSEWFVDGQHDGSLSGVEAPGVECRECGWKALLDELEKLTPDTPSPGKV